MRLASSQRVVVDNSGAPLLDRKSHTLYHEETADVHHGG